MVEPPQSDLIAKFAARFWRLGPLFWISSLQIFVVQPFVARAWPFPYSYRFNTLSDLGNTACGRFDLRPVCSPDHTLMNAMIMLLGATIVAGSLLLYHQTARNSYTAVGFWLMALGGLSTIFVGIFPENEQSWAHGAATAVSLIASGLALLVLGFSLGLPRWLKIYSVLSCLIASVAGAWLLTNRFLGIGEGTFERVAIHSITVWLIVFAAYLIRHRRPLSGHRPK